MKMLDAIAIAFVLASPALAEEAAWQKISDKDGIVVFARNLDGVPTISLRGEAVIDAPVQAVFDTMKDNSRAHEWMPMVAEKRDLQALGENQRLEYTHIKMPWPLTDRYFVNTGTVEKLGDGALKVFVKSAENPTYKEDDKVLGVLKYSEFLLTPEAGGAKTRIKLEVNTDPKGLIPKFLVNAAQKAWPRDFLMGLRRQVQKAMQLAH